MVAAANLVEAADLVEAMVKVVDLVEAMVEVVDLVEAMAAVDSDSAVVGLVMAAVDSDLVGGSHLNQSVHHEQHQLP